MNRTVHEVTFMAAKMKENGFRIPGQTDSVAENIIQEPQEIVKKENNIIIPETNWSQEQQKALEGAIVKYRKTAGSDRWQMIANCVSDKSKEECLIRYKYLCELVKSQKRSEDSEANPETTTNDIILDPERNTANVRLQEFKPVTAEDLADDLTENNEKKRSKRKERRKRRDFSVDDDSYDGYEEN